MLWWQMLDCKACLGGAFVQLTANSRHTVVNSAQHLFPAQLFALDYSAAIRASLSTHLLSTNGIYTQL